MTAATMESGAYESVLGGHESPVDTFLNLSHTRLMGLTPNTLLCMSERTKSEQWPSFDGLHRALAEFIANLIQTKGSTKEIMHIKLQVCAANKKTKKKHVDLIERSARVWLNALPCFSDAEVFFHSFSSSAGEPSSWTTFESSHHFWQEGHYVWCAQCAAIATEPRCSKLNFPCRKFKAMGSNRKFARLSHGASIVGATVAQWSICLGVLIVYSFGVILALVITWITSNLYFVLSFGMDYACSVL